MPDIIDFTVTTMYATYRVRAYPYHETRDVIAYAAKIEYVRNGEFIDHMYFFDSLIELDAWVDRTMRTFQQELITA
ncbi:hypothetical protein [Bifidobacterium myosotis]|uniref:Uncharacterized protein n=1 Tax=Bifidobacterium myosotis TaxID=1630166 RepID=A0A5M9ZIA3_9BIFI|nr:hypothetical protein [Bifidobacterium myosotis]KAA8827238.1 hypothetical protein EMO91_09315 [Bifidobacterium myosotis]